MTTQPEPRSVTEALEWIVSVEPEGSLGHGGETYYALNKRIKECARAALAATPDPAPAVVPDPDCPHDHVRCDACGEGLTGVPGTRSAPAVVPEVEAERALNRLVPLLPSTARVHEDYAIIRAAIRAEGRGALDVAWAAAEAALPDGWGIGVERNRGLYEVGAGRNEWAVWDQTGHPTLAEGLHALAAILAQREPAESQGPDGGRGT